MAVALTCWVLQMHTRRKRNRRVLDSDDDNEEQASARPTATEKAYAIHIIDTLMKLGLQRGKGRAVPMEHIALAIAIHTGDASVTSLPPAEQLALYGLARNNRDVRRDWVVDRDRRRVAQALEYDALDVVAQQSWRRWTVEAFEAERDAGKRRALESILSHVLGRRFESDSL